MTRRSCTNAFQVPDGHILQRHPPTRTMGIVINQLMSELYDLLKEIYFRDRELDPIDMYVTCDCSSRSSDFLIDNVNSSQFRVSLAIGDKKSGPFISSAEVSMGSLNDLFDLVQRKGLPRTNINVRKIGLQLSFNEKDLVRII